MSTSRPPAAPPAGHDQPAAPADNQPDYEPAEHIEDDSTHVRNTDEARSAHHGVLGARSPSPMNVPFDEKFHSTSHTRFEPQPDAEDENDENDEDGDDEAIPYPEPDLGQSIAHPPDFRPFFTLIEDTTSGEHHHPTVHYLFTDDDPDILTNAALDTLNNEHGASKQDERAVDDRFVILDLSTDGKEIISASSLSPEWQALKTHISPAPSWGREDGNAADRGMMLRISGQEANMDAMTQEKKRRCDTESLLKRFDENLHSLEGVLGPGGTVVELKDTPAAQ